jgi:hypothetical protein
MVAIVELLIVVEDADTNVLLGRDLAGPQVCVEVEYGESKCSLLC